jgi:uncharacterized membrane protein
VRLLIRIMNDQLRSTKRFLRLALWGGVAILGAIGIVAAIGRFVSVVNGGLGYDEIRRLMPAESAQEAYEFDRWFVAYPALTLLHVVPGGLFLALAPFQFSSRIRNRYVRFHRWSGRALVLAALPIGLSSLILGALFPFGGPSAASAVFLAGAFFLFALVRAFNAIRRGDVTRHREWMIRMFSIGLGIATIRVVGMILFAITHNSFHESAGTAFWIGWVSTFVAAEWWIRRTRPQRVAVSGTAVRATGA